MNTANAENRAPRSQARENSRFFAWACAAILAVAAVLRIWGITWGLPQEFNPDEPLVVPRAIDAVTTGDWNPHYFLVPSLQTELTSVAFEITYIGGHLAGKFGSADDFAEWAAWHNGTLYLIGRSVSVFLGLICVLGAAFLAREILSFNPTGESGGGSGRDIAESAGILAGFMAAVSPLAVASGRLITPDTPMLAFYVWAVWAIIRAVRTEDIRTLAWAGFLSGLAVSAKYSAAILLVPLLVGGYQLGKTSGKAGPGGLYILPLAALIPGFLIGTPYALFDMRTFLDHLSIQYSAQHEGHLGMEKAGITAIHMLADLLRFEGPVILLLSLTGIGVAWVTRRRAWWVVTPLLVLYFLEVSRWRVYADRYLLPALSLVYMFAVVAWSAIVMRVPRGFMRVGLGILLIIAMCAPPILSTVRQTRRLLLPDTRTLALEWVEENIPPGSRILLEIGGPQPSDLNAAHHREPAYDIMILPPWFSETSKGIDPTEALQAFNPEYVITTSNYRSRYESEYARQRQPGIAQAWHRYYVFLDTYTDDIYEISPGTQGRSELTGPSIRIYRLRASAPEAGDR
jgi:hypothetical protein